MWFDVNNSFSRPFDQSDCLHTHSNLEWVGVYKRLEIETNTLQWFRCVLLAMCKKALANCQTFGAWGKNECTNLLEIPHFTLSNMNSLTLPWEDAKGRMGTVIKFENVLTYCHYDRVNGGKWTWTHLKSILFVRWWLSLIYLVACPQIIVTI